MKAIKVAVLAVGLAMAGGAAAGEVSYGELVAQCEARFGSVSADAVDKCRGEAQEIVFVERVVKPMCDSKTDSSACAEVVEFDEMAAAARG